MTRYHIPISYTDSYTINEEKIKFEDWGLLQHILSISYYTCSDMVYDVNNYDDYMCNSFDDD